jgi:group II intron reverse transcriptase/maturase
MNAAEKSDSAVVARKPANKADKAAERVEPRAETEGNTNWPHTSRTQSRSSVSLGLERVRAAARQRKKERFTAVLHHVTVERLHEAFMGLRRHAATGVDGRTWQDYEMQLQGNLRDLHARVHRGTYRAQPVRRRFIAKPDGRKRPLGIAALEDKIVQRALATVLNAIYEEDFLGFSYGVRPGRNPHQAMDALAVGIGNTRVNWVLDADISGFFDAIDHEWLVRFLKHRIGDERVIRLVHKWLKAGVLDEQGWSASDRGSPQGAVISPLLCNVYLHYAFDLWVRQWRNRQAQAQMIVVRYADDIVVGFESLDEAQRFQQELHQRLGQFGLKLNADKTRLVEFGAQAAERRRRRGMGRPSNFDFLGMTYICGRNRRGGFQLQRKSRSDRMRAKLRQIKDQLQRHRHASVSRQGKWLRAVVNGYYQYHAVPTNSRSLKRFRFQVVRLWCRSLRRRSQRHRLTWQRMKRLATRWLPYPRILHPWPALRGRVTTQGRSRMPESGTYGSVRGVPSNGHPYRD